MFHLADMASTFAVSMFGGCHTILSRFTPVAVLETIQRARVTNTGLVTTMVNALIQAPELWRLRSVELAAARLKVLTVHQIADRIDDPFDVLSGSPRGVLARQQTLRASLD